MKLYGISLETYFPLDAGVWDARDDLDEDTLEYLSAPISVQQMDDTIWQTINSSLAEQFPAIVGVRRDPEAKRMLPCCARCGTPLCFHDPSCSNLTTPVSGYEPSGWLLLLNKFLKACENSSAQVSLIWDRKQNRDINEAVHRWL